jgi:hypothetical protein
MPSRGSVPSFHAVGPAAVNGGQIAILMLGIVFACPSVRAAVPVARMDAGHAAFLHASGGKCHTGAGASQRATAFSARRPTVHHARTLRGPPGGTAVRELPATVTQRVRLQPARWFRRKSFLSREAAADMLTWQHSGFSVDASVRISLADRDVPGYFRSLEHLLRYCARPAFARGRLSVVPGTGNRPERVRSTLPRHKRGNWIGPGRSRKSTRPGASGVIELTPFEFLDRLAVLIPPPRRHRHRYHGVFAPNHPLRQAVTAVAIGNLGKQRDAKTGEHAGVSATAGSGCRGSAGTVDGKSCHHDTPRIAWAKLLARVGEEFPLACPRCGGDIRPLADGRQEPASFEPEVRKRMKARMASAA